MGNFAPDVDCPVCGTRFEQADYFECSEGSEINCPSCGAQLNVSSIETVMCWTICTRKEYEEAQAKQEAWRQKQRDTFLNRQRRGDG